LRCLRLQIYLKRKSLPASRDGLSNLKDDRQARKPNRHIQVERDMLQD
jgi:hypothetical protein